MLNFLDFWKLYWIFWIMIFEKKSFLEKVFWKRKRKKKGQGWTVDLTYKVLKSIVQKKDGGCS